MMTFAELKEALGREEETTLLELLDITSPELVELIEYRIETQQEKLRAYYGEDDPSLDR